MGESLFQPWWIEKKTKLGNFKYVICLKQHCEHINLYDTRTL